MAGARARAPWLPASAGRVHGGMAELVDLYRTLSELCGIDPATIDPGVQGATGAQGEVGDQGPQGPKGKDGAHGEEGNQGAEGDAGIEGLKGEQGDTGVQGEQGRAGKDGPLAESPAKENFTGAASNPPAVCPRAWLAPPAKQLPRTPHCAARRDQNFAGGLRMRGVARGAAGERRAGRRV